ncbi:MAG: oxidoreductase [Planctomyces sp.]|nr:oxidoreductase [Planctomyces sp.]
MDVDLNFRPQLPIDRSVPIGCIGAGFIMADCQLPAYRQQGLNPTAIAARTTSRAAEVADRHQLKLHEDIDSLLNDESIPVLDIAVPPDAQLPLIRKAVTRPHICGILAQKPLADNFADACEIVRLCREAGITLAVNQNMRYDQAVRACQQLLTDGVLGEPVFATLDMRAIPHWMPWQERLGSLTLRIMSIHHLDTFRFWFGSPRRVFASIRIDPRTKFAHEDGICSYILEYDSGLRAGGWDDVWAGPVREGAGEANGIHWRVEGTAGLALGTVGWPDYPERSPSTLDYSTINDAGKWHRPRWEEVWFPDAFAGPMCELLCALEANSQTSLNGEDNLETLALVEACYVSAREHRAVELDEILTAAPGGG